jgi:hypothetical protein
VRACNRLNDQQKSFFHWLAGQSGYKSRISYGDVEYFNNNAKNARIAHTRRDIFYPGINAANGFDNITSFLFLSEGVPVTMQFSIQHLEMTEST